MKGKNRIYVNQQTMLEAIQHYLTTVLFATGKAPTATSVKRESDTHYGSESFVVEVESTQQEEAK